MRKINLLIVVLLCFCQSVMAHDSASAVLRFKDAIKSNNPEIIADYIVYPLTRKNPVPDIHNKQEFINRYDSLFDKSMRDIIINSKPNDWEMVGSKGIMLYNGLLWIDNNGKLIAINVFSEKESKYANDWEALDKSSINYRLKKYYKNINIFETQKYLGRIDEIKGSKEYQYSYRLALWNRNQKMSEDPIIIVENGTLEFLGSSNNHIYSFKSEEYTYVFEVTYVGPINLIPYQLIILKDNNDISRETATITK